MHALITGGSSGIGKAVAERLFLQGFRITLIARQQSTLHSAAQDIAGLRPERSDQIHTASVSVTDSDELTAAISESYSRFGPYQFVLCCAGVVHPSKFDELSEGRFRETFEVNFFGSVGTVRSVLPYVDRNDGCRIGFVSSTAGFLGIYGYSAYAASKYAIRGYAEAMICEYDHEGIKFCVTFPPDTDTPQLAHEIEQRPSATSRIAGKFRPMQADDVARSIIAGMKKGKQVIVPGLANKALYYCHVIFRPVIFFEILRALRVHLRKEAAAVEGRQKQSTDSAGQ